MSTMNATAAAAAAGEATGIVKSAKAPRSFSVSLHDAAGAMMRITAIRRADGSAVTYAVHTTKAADGKRHNDRGVTEKHASMELAKVAVEKLSAAFVKLNWVRKVAVRGYTAKPDAFDISHLPTAAVAAPPSAAVKASRKR
jgi:hypothetical protein